MDSPSSRRGFYSYRVQCSGTVTSVRARGFCPARTNGSVVVMVVINSTADVDSLMVDVTNLAAECNTSAPVGSDYYEGYVSSDNLNIRVEFNGFLSVIFNPNCSNGRCFFQPTLVNRTSNHTLLFFTEQLKVSVPPESILFSANIRPIATMDVSNTEEEGEGNKADIIWASISAILLLCLAVVATFVVWRVVKTKQARKGAHLPTLPSDYLVPLSSNPHTVNICPYYHIMCMLNIIHTLNSAIYIRVFVIF